MKKYNIIYADPPWEYDMKSMRGCANNHYGVMKLNQMLN